MFQLSPSSAHTAEPFLLPTLPGQHIAWGSTRTWQGTQPGQLPLTNRRVMPHHVASRAAIKPGRRRTAGHLKLWHLSSQAIVMHDEACLPGNGWASLCWWDAGNEFLSCFACVCSFWFTYSTVLISTPKFSHFLPFRFSPPPHWGRAGKWLHGAELPTGVSLQQHLSNNGKALVTGGSWLSQHYHVLSALTGHLQKLSEEASFPSMTAHRQSQVQRRLVLGPAAIFWTLHFHIVTLPSLEKQQPSSLLTPHSAPADNSDKLPDQLTQWRKSRGAALYSYLAWWLQFYFKLNCSNSAFQACIHENLPVFSNCKTQSGNIHHLCLEPCLGLPLTVITILILRARELRIPQ